MAAGAFPICAVLGLCIALVGVTGCPGTPPPDTRCEEDADCDDGRFCNGEETCGTNGQCEDGEPPCPAEDCVENADFCPECTDDADCDDGLFCNGDESCNNQRECESTGNPCAEGELCNEATDSCGECVTDGDCDDGEFCNGSEVCSNGACGSGDAPCADDETCNEDTDQCEGAGCETDDDCDDGLFCNGQETCLAGECEDADDPCADDEICDEEADFCSAPCETDEDCADDLFCNGAETCGDDGNCDPGTNPCAAGEVCDEDTDTCEPEPGEECTTDDDCGGDACNPQVCEIGTNGTGTCVAGVDPCPGQDCVLGDNDQPVCIPEQGVTIDFTLNQDSLIGTADADTFRAPLALTGQGVQANTLQNGDSAQGLAGTDTLNATYINPAAGNVVLAPTLNGIEIINLSDFGGAGTTDFSFLNVTGATSISSVGSLADVDVNDVNVLTNLGLTNTDFDLDVTFVAPAGSGNADAISLTLTGARDTDPNTAQGASVIITTPANGPETINLVSAGAAANTLEALTLNGGTTLTTLNVSGAAPLAIRRNAPLPGTLTTINAGSATGATDLTVGGAQNVTYTGGSGNDIINFAGSYTTADTINGGGGTDALGLNAALAAVAVNQANVTGIEEILIVDTLLGQTIDVTRFGATDAILDTTGNGVLLVNLPSNITLGTGNRTITFNNDDLNDQLNVTVSGVGTGDVLTANFFNADHIFGGTTVAFIGAETVNLVSANGLDGTAADGNANTAIGITLTPTTGTGTLSISGPVSFQVSGAITAGTIDASLAGAAFIHETTTGSVNAASATITGSAFNDELVGGNGNDAISGGEGNDFIKGGQGADILTGGGGTDHFFFDNTNQFGDTIADMTAGQDNVGLASGIINFAGVAGTENAPVELTAANFETARANVTSIIAADALKIVRISTEMTTADITTQTGAAVAAYVLVFDSTIGRGVLYHDADWSSAAGRTLVARFENITSNAQLQALTFTDFEEID